MIDVAPYQLKIINAILQKHVPYCEVRAFGSRVTWTAKDYSDLDLAIVGKKRLADKILYALKEDFEESDLPFRVDVLDWHSISDEFKGVINKGYEVLQKSKTKFKETEIGKIPEDWEIEVADTYCDRVTDGTHDSPKKTKSGKILITSRHLKEHGLDFDNAYLISEEDFNEVNKRSKVEQWDVIISMIGTIGLTHLERNKEINYAVKNVGLFKCGNDNKGKWIYYWLKSRIAKEYIRTHRSGTTQEYITLASLRQFPIAHPKHDDEFRKIIYFLESITEKIELNQQMNKTLESIGQALFKRCFVDFEFPFDFAQGKPDENGNPYKSSGGQMVDSELGEIPAGWEVKPIDEIANFLNGLALQKYPARGENYLPVIKIREMKQGITDACDRASKDIPSEYVIQDGNLLFSWSGSLEVSFWMSGEGALNQHLFKVTSKKYSKWFYYFWIKHYLPHYKHIAQGKATTMGHIQRGHLKETLVLIPQDGLLDNMTKVLSPMIDLIINNGIAIQKLSQIRDSLLPRLMSGRIRVRMNR